MNNEQSAPQTYDPYRHVAQLEGQVAELQQQVLIGLERAKQLGGQVALANLMMRELAALRGETEKRVKELEEKYEPLTPIVT